MWSRVHCSIHLYLTCKLVAEPIQSVRLQLNYISKVALFKGHCNKIYIYQLSNYNNLENYYKYNYLLIPLHISLLILSLVQAPFPALLVIIFVSILRFVMVLVIVISIAYKVILQRQNRRHMIDLPMQVLGLKDENTDPILVVLGEWPLICEKNRTNMVTGWQRMIGLSVERRDVSKAISNHVIKMLGD